MEKKLPLARSRDLVMQEVSGEILLYNLKNNQAFCLNQTSALVWKLCDGQTNLQTVQEQLQKKLNIKVNDDLIFLTLAELHKAELIKDYEPINEIRVSRRRFLLNYAFPLALLPMVTMIVAPLAIQAASCGATVCSMAADCPPITTPCPPECLGNGCLNSCTNNCCQVVCNSFGGGGGSSGGGGGDTGG